MTRVKIRNVMGELYSPENVRLYKQGWTFSEIRAGRQFMEEGFSMEFEMVMGRRRYSETGLGVPDNLQPGGTVYSQLRLDL